MAKNKSHGQGYNFGKGERAKEIAAKLKLIKDKPELAKKLFGDG